MGTIAWKCWAVAISVAMVIASMIALDVVAGAPATAASSPAPIGPGGFTLDGFGGLHPFATGVGTVPGAVSAATYWPGWDIARGVATLPGDGGGYVLDGFGGIHAFRVGAGPTAPTAKGSPYWFGWDIARGIALVPDGSGGYVLDGFGGLHPFALGGENAPPAASGAAYWPGQDMAQGVAIARDGKGGYVVDRNGRLHRFAIGTSGAKPPRVAPWITGSVAVRGVTLGISSTSGYTIDGYGGLHGFAAGSSSTPPATVGATYWPGWDIARDAVLVMPIEKPPVALLRVSPMSGVAPLDVTADASGSTDTDLTPISAYTFDFGDGSARLTQSGPIASHVYRSTGGFTVKVTVADTGGSTDADSGAVSVVDSPGTPIRVSAGYYDTHHPGLTQPKPNPWSGSANVVFVGQADGPGGGWDSSAVRVENLTTAAMSVTVTVDIGRKHYALWGTNQLRSGQSLILAQTSYENFDGSDDNKAGCYGCDPKLCTTAVDNTVPVIHVTYGTTSVDYRDSSQVLNTGGVDRAGCPYTGKRNDESEQWSLLTG